KVSRGGGPLVPLGAAVACPGWGEALPPRHAAMVRPGAGGESLLAAATAGFGFARHGLATAARELPVPVRVLGDLVEGEAEAAPLAARARVGDDRHIAGPHDDARGEDSGAARRGFLHVLAEEVGTIGLGAREAGV